MLGRYFSFLEDPFNLSPDPRFLYANPMYREAYDTLFGIVRDRKGYMALTGEAGSGKTTLLKTLMNHLDTGYRCIYFEYTNLTFDDFLDLACNKLGLNTERKDCGDELKTFLLEQSQNGITVAFIIDEAQNIPPESLKEILTFTDGLSKQDNLLQIILSGQPQLEARLEEPQLRALKERLSLHYRLSPLQGDEVGSFIRHRLSVAGNPSGDIMTSEAIQKVTLHAQGRPRLINMLCNRALITAFAYSRKTISAEVMEEAIQELLKEQECQVNTLEKAPASVPAQTGTGSSKPTCDRLGHASRQEVPVVLPAKMERPAQRVWGGTSLPAAIEAGRKALHRGMDRLSKLLPDQPIQLASKLTAGNGKLPFKASLPLALAAARNTLHQGRKKLSGLIFEQPIGVWKVATIAVLLWSLLYPVLEQDREKTEPAPVDDMAAQTSTPQRDQITPLSTPATAAESDSTVAAEKSSRTPPAAHQKSGVEVFESAALEVVTEQVDGTALSSRQDLGPTLLGRLPTPLTEFPYTAVIDTTAAAMADSTARMKKLEQKLLASEERISQAEAQLALSREELVKAQARIQPHELQIETNAGQAGQLHDPSDELKDRVVSLPKHLPMQNINEAKTPDPIEQPPTQDQAGLEIMQQPPTDPTSGLDQLLDRADQLLRARHLTMPAGDNALEIYRQVLNTDPDNKTGLNGIERIKQQYLKWAVVAQEKSDWLNAGKYYQKALAVDPSNPEAEAGLRVVRKQAAVQASRQKDALERLAQQGISATAKALLIYAEQGDIEAVRSLLAAGISPNAKLPGGWTALMSAATHGHIEVIRTLLSLGAQVNMKNDDGKTALTAAAWNGHADVVKELLASGAAVNEQNNDGWTALMYAAWNGHRQVVETLLEGEASIAVKDANNWTALTAASSEGHVEIVKILEMAGGS